MLKVIPTDPQFFSDLPDPQSEDPGGGELVELRDLQLRRKVRALPALERRVIGWYFGLDGNPMTLAEIGERIGASKQYAAKVKDRALERLRDSYGETTYREAMGGESAAA